MTDKSVVAKPVHFIESATRKVRFAEPTVLTNLHLDAFQRGDPVPGAVEQHSNPLNLETSDLDPITPEEDALAMGVIAALGFTRQVHDTVVRGMRAGLAKAGAVIVPGWQPIAALDHNDYVLGFTERSDGCTDRSYFLGRRYDIRRNALINEWTGRWREVSFFIPLLSAPSAHSIQSGGEGGEAK